MAKSGIRGCSGRTRAGEDDEPLGRPGHRDVAVDRALDARAERLRVDQDDQVELQALRRFRGQRPDTGRRRRERGIADCLAWARSPTMVKLRDGQRASSICRSASVSSRASSTMMCANGPDRFPVTPVHVVQWGT